MPLPVGEANQEGFVQRSVSREQLAFLISNSASRPQIVHHGTQQTRQSQQLQYNVIVFASSYRHTPTQPRLTDDHMWLDFLNDRL